MPLDHHGLLVREAVNDVPTRCYCCERPRVLRRFRNGPKTEIFVCPATRAALIAHDGAAIFHSGQFTGSLDGV